MQALVGIDIGGTSVKFGLIQYGQTFRVLKQASIPTQSSDPGDVLADRIAAAVKQFVHSAGNPTVVGVGVGCPGLIDPVKGVVHISANMPTLREFALRDALRERLGLGVEIQNDANAAVLGEWLFSPASKGCGNLCLLTLGTGVGGGVVCDGHLLIGADNAATELGHLKVEYHNPAPCGCGRRGCVEAYAGAGGITRLAQQFLASGTRTSLVADQLTTKDIALAAAAGDQLAQDILRKVGEYLGRAMSALIETFDPEKILLGGGASAAMEFLRPGIQQSLLECCSFVFTRDRCAIERSAFPDDINVIGAAATYLNAHPEAK